MKNKIISVATIFTMIFCLLFSSPAVVKASGSEKTIVADNLMEYSRDANAEQWYRISLKYNEDVNIHLSAATNDYLEIVVLDEFGEFVTGYSEIYAGEPLNFGIIPSRTGNYYVGIFGPGAGKYNLGIFHFWSYPGVSTTKRKYLGAYTTSSYISPGRKKTSEFGYDYYRFTAQKGADLSVNLKSLISSGSQVLELMDKNNKVITQTNTISYNTTGSIKLKVPYTGIYYIKVTGDSGEYDLTFTGLDKDIDSDKDGLLDSSEYYYGSSISKADTDEDGVSDYNEIIQGRDAVVKYDYARSALTKAGDKSNAFSIPVFDKDVQFEYEYLLDKWFRFKLNQGEKIDIVVYGSNFDYGSIDFEVYNSKGELIGSRGGVETYMYGIMGLTAKIADTYFIKVSGDATGKFKIGLHHHWNSSGLKDSARSFNSSKETAKYITTALQTKSVYDEEWYRFPVVKGTPFSVSLSAFLSLGAAEMELYDEAGKRLASKGNTANGQSGAVKYTPTTTGWYYIRVIGNFTGQYNFTLTGIKPEGDQVPPTISSVTPAANSKAVPLNSAFTIKLSESVLKGSTFSEIKLLDAKGKKVAAVVTINNSIVTIKPTAKLAANKKYSVVIPAAAVKDAAGNNLKAAATYSFTTAVK